MSPHVQKPAERLFIRGEASSPGLRGPHSPLCSLSRYPADVCADPGASLVTMPLRCHYALVSEVLPEAALPLV